MAEKIILNKKIFDTDIEKIPTRKGFGEGLLEAGKSDVSIVALCADLTESTQMELFKKEFPDRFIEIGVAEQNLVTVASGMAAIGKLPFVSSYAMFSPGRNWEQIRTTITYNDRPAVIVGSHTGVSVGPDGGTHQALEDIALMRVLPNMIVVQPCDAIEAKKATLALARIKKPAYLRLTREKTPVMTTPETLFEIGKSYIMYKSEIVNPIKKVGIVGCGPILYEALYAAKKLEEKNVSVTVLNVHTIKPLDYEGILALAHDVDVFITVEEHQKVGGLGGAVCEYMAEKNLIPVFRIGVADTYGQSGTPEELIKHYKIDSDAIIEKVSLL